MHTVLRVALALALAALCACGCGGDANDDGGARDTAAEKAAVDVRVDAAVGDSDAVDAGPDLRDGSLADSDLGADAGDASVEAAVDGIVTDSAVDALAADAGVDSPAGDTTRDATADQPAGDTTRDQTADQPAGDTTRDQTVDHPAGDTSVDTTVAASWLDDTLQPFPSLLSQLGLFPNPVDRAVADGRLFYFEPRYALWTDGADKARWLFLPSATKINNATKAWSYPDGTVFFKHFEFPGQPVETRVMRRRQGSFDFAIYQWNSAGTDATLLSGNNVVPVTIVGRPSLNYVIPKESHCKDCHDKNVQQVSGNPVKVPVIGFDELRLNHTLSGQTATQIATLAAQGAFTSALPSSLEVIQGNATAIAAKGWIHGNCAHCHNSGFKYEANHALLEGTTVNVPQNKPLIVPGDASNSRLYRSAFQWGSQGVPDMPPVGMSVTDAAGATAVGNWINSLP